MAFRRRREGHKVTGRTQLTRRRRRRPCKSANGTVDTFKHAISSPVLSRDTSCARGCGERTGKVASGAVHTARPAVIVTVLSSSTGHTGRTPWLIGEVTRDTMETGGGIGMV